MMPFKRFSLAIPIGQTTRRKLTFRTLHCCDGQDSSSSLSTTRSKETINQPKQQQHGTLPLQIPPPTWSIASLELEKQHPPVDMSILQTLAKRALIDLSQVPTDPPSLQQEVGNMMHMMNQIIIVQQQQQQQDQEATESVDNDEADAHHGRMYDVPRNVQAAPLRQSSNSSSLSNTNKDNDDQVVAQQVWDSFLAPQTQLVGKHAYFVIPTDEAPPSSS